MKTRIVLFLGLGIATGSVIHGWKFAHHPTAHQPAPREATRAQDEDPAERMIDRGGDASIAEDQAQVVAANASSAGTSSTPVLPPQGSARPASMPAKKAAKAAPPPGSPPKPARQLGDPVARVALSWVGADAEAEAYWVEAINDPSLSAHERQDLIEDLNEEGFFDPRHPTFEDLPLIVSRLLLIEELAPDAMDEVNSDAFAEAKKDLLNMALVAQQ